MGGSESPFYYDFPPAPSNDPSNISTTAQNPLDTFATFNESTDTNMSFLNESEFGYIRYPAGFQVCIYIMYNVVFVAAVTGNLLVIYVVGYYKKMRTVTNYLIGNLAVGDLLMALLCVPFSYISVLLQYWPFGRLLCHIVTPAQAVCVFVSAYSLVALAIDRYIAILYPLRPRLRRSQALIVIGWIWVVAFVTAIPIAFFTTFKVDLARGLPICVEDWDVDVESVAVLCGWLGLSHESLKMGYGWSLLALQYFFPITVLIYTYTRIALEIWGKKKPLQEDVGAACFQESRLIRLSKARRKTVVMTLCVVVAYTLAWLPLNLLVLYMDTLTYDNDEVILPFLEYVFFACHWLAMAHTTYNPIIYAWMNSKFRDAFVCVFSSLIGRKKVGGGTHAQQMQNNLLHNQQNGSSLMSRLNHQHLHDNKPPDARHHRLSTHQSETRFNHSGIKDI